MRFQFVSNAMPETRLAMLICFIVLGECFNALTKTRELSAIRRIIMAKPKKVSTKKRVRKQVVKKKYHGIVDCHGIESLVPYNQEDVTLYYIRATTNRQRHAVYYQCKLTNKQYQSVMACCRRGEYADALKLLRVATPLNVPKEQAKSLDLIPNSDLDPWR
jgi:hypothetical protein